jgi:ATP-dependent helicase/nuclease subunit A
VKRDMEKTRDEVRIMTVHGAKGLQAPIVFLPDTTRLPRHDSGLLWTEDEGSVPLWTPDAEGEERQCRNIKEGRRLEREREYRRLLYVAMTRAEDELYICGWKGGSPVSDKSWYALAGTAAHSGWRTEGGRLILSSDQIASPRTKPSRVAQHARTQLPDWVKRPPGDEPSPSRPLSPSQMDPVATAGSPLPDQTARLRGTLIHRLLQYLPEIMPDERESAIDRFTSSYAHDLSQGILAQIKQEVRAVLEHPDFVLLFSGDSIAEAQVSGVVHDDDGNPITVSGQIDRLAVLGDTVYIIDYKTGTPPETEADTPRAYLKQMGAYRKLIARIYPDKDVRCALLWTAAPRLMPIT